MVNKKIYLLLFTLILVIASRLRLPKLDSIPPHLSNDEISIAYDAYSVLRTGYDEHHHFLPLSFKSHGTYKAPLAIYLSIPTTILLGRGEHAVRLPSAILGILTVLFLGLLIRELSQNKVLALIGSFVLAISPWHIHSSRMALESNIALFFVCFGIYLFFYGLRKKRYGAIIGSSFSLALSLYGYHTEWGYVPLLSLVLFFLYRKKFVKKKIIYIWAVTIILLGAPLLFDSIKNFDSGMRPSSEMFYKEPHLTKILEDENIGLWQQSRLLGGAYFDNYLAYHNFSHLFFASSNLLDQDDVFQTGLFLFPLLPCFIIGLFNLKKIYRKDWLFVLLLFLISPLVPATTRGGYNNVRNLVSIIPYTLIISAGSLVIWRSFKNMKIFRLGFLGLVLIAFVYFWAIYFYYFPIENGQNYQYGYKQIAAYIMPLYPRLERIVVDPRFGETNVYSGVPHLYLPYFTGMDPRQMFSRISTQTALSLDKYEFRDINWNLEKIESSSLYIVPVSNTPPPGLLKLLQEITLPNRQPAFAIYTNKADLD